MVVSRKPAHSDLAPEVAAVRGGRRAYQELAISMIHRPEALLLEPGLKQASNACWKTEQLSSTHTGSTSARQREHVVSHAASQLPTKVSWKRTRAQKGISTDHQKAPRFL